MTVQTLTADAQAFVDKVVAARVKRVAEAGRDVEPMRDAITWQTGAEAAAKLFLNPIGWNVSEPRRADLGGWIDVLPLAKGEPKGFALRPGCPASRAYLVVSVADLPRYSLMGWAWGWDVQQERFRRDAGAEGGPAFFMPMDARHVKPVHDLWLAVRARENPEVLEQLEAWRVPVSLECP